MIDLFVKGHPEVATVMTLRLRQTRGLTRLAAEPPGGAVNLIQEPPQLPANVA
jgi:hypothetical protein